jgi:hypothetical protein
LESDNEISQEEPPALEPKSIEGHLSYKIVKRLLAKTKAMRDREQFDYDEYGEEVPDPRKSNSELLREYRNRPASKSFEDGGANNAVGAVI